MPFPPKAQPVMPPKEAERDAMSPAMARQKARAMALRARRTRAPQTDGSVDPENQDGPFPATTRAGTILGNRK